MTVLCIFGGGAAALLALGPPERRGPAPLPVATTPANAAAAPAAWDGHIPPPDPALLEPSRGRTPVLLPRIGVDGRLPRIAYRRPTPPGSRPRIALILTGIGQNAGDSRAAIAKLPGAVTLAFSAYVPDPAPLLSDARTAGHELLASIPMEPDGYPLIDAGPLSLLTGSTPAQNAEFLLVALGRSQGYAGATGASDGMRGEQFARQTSSFGLMLDELARRGLFYIDPRPGAPAPPIAGRSADLIVDDPASRAEIEGKLAALERLAREHGSALGIAGPPRPVTVERIAAWSRELDSRGIDLVPVSALVLEPKP